MFRFCEELTIIVELSTGDSPGIYGVEMTLLQFPADRRTRDVRRCAETLSDLHGHAANQFWRSEMAEFSRSMRQRGADDLEISRQAALFMHAVQMELQMMFADQDADVSAG
jgi:hypothetical protein